MRCEQIAEKPTMARRGPTPPDHWYVEPPSVFSAIFPTGINESGLVSETAEAVDQTTENNLGTVGLLAGFGSGFGQVLPPGVIGDVTAGINSAGIVGGNSEGLPVLWIPNP